MELHGLSTDAGLLNDCIALNFMNINLNIYQSKTFKAYFLS